MSNVLGHRFVSPKLDGADATQVQPSAWNDGHRFSGGTNGQILTRDTTDATFGATWTTPAPPAGYVPFGVSFYVNGAAQAGDVYQIPASGAVKQGNAVWFFILLTLGPTATPAGQWYLSLPYAVGTTAIGVGTGMLVATSGVLPVWAYTYTQTDRVGILYVPTGGTGLLSFVTATTPAGIGIGPGNYLEIRGSYLAAG